VIVINRLALKGERDEIEIETRMRIEKKKKGKEVCGVEKFSSGYLTVSCCCY
jgi:hypothetical protein